MEKTREGLVKFVKSKIGTPYVYGAKGEVCSKEKIESLQKMYGKQCVWDSDINKAGKVCVDCSGLISWYTGIIRGSYQYLETAKEKIPINQINNSHIGWAVWLKGHIGVYIGNGRYIAADGSAYGVREADMSNQKWVYALKLCDIDYKDSEKSPSTTTDVNVRYRVRTKENGWLAEVINLNDYAGLNDNAILDIAIGVDRGSIKYRVHIKGGGWLPYVTGYNIGDINNGYAGNGKEIDLVEVYYETPNEIRPYKKAKYRVCPCSGSYYKWQYDNEKGNGQDGYAGSIGRSICKLQIEIE